MKEKISLFYKILIVVMGGIGLYLNFEMSSISDNIIYFTIQSNLLCFLFYLVIVILTLIKKLKKDNVYYMFKGMVTMSITITMFVYQLLISTNGGVPGYENHMLACNFVHLFVPLMIIFDYIIFGEKGNLKKNYPFIWSLVLVAYILFDIIYVVLGGTFIGGTTYPYFYMDIEKYGLVGVFINCLLVYIFFVGYGFIVQALDNKLSTNSNK
jgi:hypothetical protein